MSHDHTTDDHTRTPDDDAIIGEAKRCLMVLGLVDEPTAYHALRRTAMTRRLKLRELAKWLLEDVSARVAEIRE